MALQRAERIDLITGDKVDYRKLHPLVKGLIDRNTTNLFLFYWGKSFAMIDMGISIAKGDDFWDQYRIPGKMQVLIVVGEGGGYHKRVTKLPCANIDITDRSRRTSCSALLTEHSICSMMMSFSMQSRNKLLMPSAS